MKTISPKAEFLTEKEATEFAEIMSKPVVQRGIRTALLQFACDQVRSETWETAARSHHELQGAKEFAFILQNLTEPEVSTKRETTQNLQWQHKSQILRPQPPKKP